MMLRSWVRSPFRSWARVKCSSWVGSSPCRLPPTLSCSLPLSRFPANQLRALLRLHEVRCGAQRVGSCAEGPPSSHGCPIPARSKVRVAAGFLLRPRRQHGCQVVGTLLSIACLLFMHSFIPVFAQKYLSSCPGQNGICGNVETETYWTVAGSFCTVTKCLSMQLVTNKSCLALGFWPLDTHCPITWSVLWVTGIPGGDLTETQSHTLVPEAVELYSNYRIHHFFCSLYVIMMFTSTEFIFPKFLYVTCIL